LKNPEGPYSQTRRSTPSGKEKEGAVEAGE
jgi:hypothetical protein